MCGIFGVIQLSKSGYQEQLKISNFLKQATLTGSVRGEHSTGLFYVDQKDSAQYIKKAVDGSFFKSYSTVHEVLSDPGKYKTIVGHHRHATTGNITDANAHPFSAGHITLVHNGTIYNSDDILEKGEAPPDTDSEAIAIAMERTNSVEDKKQLIEKLDGAYALIWNDLSNNTINIVKNYERPLFGAFLKKQNTMLFSSEEGMLHWLIKRNKIDSEDLFAIKDDVLHTWELSSNNVRVYEKVQLADYNTNHFSSVYNWNYYNSAYDNNHSNNRANNTLRDLGLSIGTILKDIKIDSYVDHIKNKVRTVQFFRKDASGNNAEIKCYNHPKTEDISSPFDGRIVTAYKVHKHFMGEDKISQVHVIEVNYIKPKNTNSDVPLLLPGPDSTLIEEHDLAHLIKGGCSYCAAPLNVDDYIIWGDGVFSDSPFCNKVCKEEAYNLMGETN